MIKKFHLYFITEKLEELNLDYVKKIGAILILRKPNRFKRNELKKFNDKCTKRNINLFIPNDIKTLFHCLCFSLVHCNGHQKVKQAPTSVNLTTFS